MLLNLFVPGAGLAPIRREWLGLALALLFAVCVNLWIAGQWIAPLAIPHWLTVLALGLAIAGWGAAQILLVHLGRRHDAIQREVDSLVTRADRDLAASEPEGAAEALEAAAALDAERPDVIALLARLRDSRHDDGANP